ncbi:MAG: UDP-N-acetylglucosamine--N-acetylmuramyl-(pentapeptide) pyrophosphoryl-undecaprenol N-acetylglucosamine transferase [Phycisphaerae bacterium]|nr:UDP-N-acetylglucosamine--N-acetylmuramyl-(pentapeptide) pyrophosphoryl-undecaprenol N-acetylglucosamine transferase [Phycisphaerae bacterium]
MGDNRPLMVLAGGGTGGHLYPGLAVIEAMRQLRPDFDFVVYGTTRPIDRKLTEHRKIPLIEQSVQGIPKRIGQVWPFIKGWFTSVKIAKRNFRERPPAVVLGLGGYAAGPPLTAAISLKIPTAIFNPDAVPGVANRRYAPKVSRVFVQWRETIDSLGRMSHVYCTGCPVRPEFASVTRDNGIKALKLDPAKKTLLITGASQGAWSINASVVELIDLWRDHPDWQIVHLTGTADLTMCREKYAAAKYPAVTLAFTEHMHLCMAASDLILSRAGASTLAEITALGKPSVLMPYPFDKKKHQLANARVLASASGAVIVDDSNNPAANAKLLRRELGDLMKSEHRRARMGEIAAAMGRHDAAARIAQGLLEIAGMEVPE